MTKNKTTTGTPKAIRPAARIIRERWFKKEVLENSRLSLVQFKTTWSGACQIIAPVFEDLAKSYSGEAGFFSIDAERETGITKTFGVQEFPTILFFKQGEVIDHAVGLTAKNILTGKIENALKNRK
ncbi:thioredoxin family protein [Flavitalea flava]